LTRNRSPELFKKLFEAAILKDVGPLDVQPQIERLAQEESHMEQMKREIEELKKELKRARKHRRKN